MSDPIVVQEFVIKLHQREIHRQAEYATLALRDFERNLYSGSPDSTNLWFMMDAALGAIARVSDILWPAGNREPAASRARARATELRERFGIGDATYLSDKKVRNSFEHFAERVDAWAESFTGGAFVDTHVGQPDFFGAIPDSDVARAFNPSTNVVRVFGDSLDLRKVMAELAAIEVLVPDPDESTW